MLYSTKKPYSNSEIKETTDNSIGWTKKTAFTYSNAELAGLRYAVLGSLNSALITIQNGANPGFFSWLTGYSLSKIYLNTRLKDKLTLPKELKEEHFGLMAASALSLGTGAAGTTIGTAWRGSSALLNRILLNQDSIAILIEEGVSAWFEKSFKATLASEPLLKGYNGSNAFKIASTFLNDPLLWEILQRHQGTLLQILKNPVLVDIISALEIPEAQFPKTTSDRERKSAAFNQEDEIKRRTLRNAKVKDSPLSEGEKSYFRTAEAIVKTKTSRESKSPKRYDDMSVISMILMALETTKGLQFFKDLIMLHKDEAMDLALKNKTVADKARDLGISKELLNSSVFQIFDNLTDTITDDLKRLQLWSIIEESKVTLKKLFVGEVDSAIRVSISSNKAEVKKALEDCEKEFKETSHTAFSIAFKDLSIPSFYKLSPAELKEFEIQYSLLIKSVPNYQSNSNVEIFTNTCSDIFKRMRPEIDAEELFKFRSQVKEQIHSIFTKHNSNSLKIVEGLETKLLPTIQKNASLAFEKQMEKLGKNATQQDFENLINALCDVAIVLDIPSIVEKGNVNIAQVITTAFNLALPKADKSLAIVPATLVVPIIQMFFANKHVEQIRKSAPDIAQAFIVALKMQSKTLPIATKNFIDEFKLADGKTPDAIKPFINTIFNELTKEPEVKRDENIRTNVLKIVSALKVHDRSLEISLDDVKTKLETIYKDSLNVQSDIATLSSLGTKVALDFLSNIGFGKVIEILRRKSGAALATAYKGEFSAKEDADKHIFGLLLLAAEDNPVISLLVNKHPKVVLDILESLDDKIFQDLQSSKLHETVISLLVNKHPKVVLDILESLDDKIFQDLQSSKLHEKVFNLINPDSRIDQKLQSAFDIAGSVLDIPSKIFTNASKKTDAYKKAINLINQIKASYKVNYHDQDALIEQLSDFKMPEVQLDALLAQIDTSSIFDDAERAAWIKDFKEARSSYKKEFISSLTNIAKEILETSQPNHGLDLNAIISDTLKEEDLLFDLLNIFSKDNIDQFGLAAQAALKLSNEFIDIDAIDQQEAMKNPNSIFKYLKALKVDKDSKVDNKAKYDLAEKFGEDFSKIDFDNIFNSILKLAHKGIQIGKPIALKHQEISRNGLRNEALKKHQQNTLLLYHAATIAEGFIDLPAKTLNSLLKDKESIANITKAAIHLHSPMDGQTKLQDIIKEFDLYSKSLSKRFKEADGVRAKFAIIIEVIKKIFKLVKDVIYSPEVQFVATFINELTKQLEKTEIQAEIKKLSEHLKNNKDGFKEIIQILKEQNPALKSKMFNRFDEILYEFISKEESINALFAFTGACSRLSPLYFLKNTSPKHYLNVVKLVIELEIALVLNILDICYDKANEYKQDCIKNDSWLSKILSERENASGIGVPAAA